MHYTENSILIEKDEMKSILSNFVEMQDAIVSKVSSVNSGNRTNSSKKVSTKDSDISGVVTNITEKILGDINAMMLGTNLNSAIKVQNTESSMEENCQELETSPQQPICDKSKLVKQEIIDKSLQNLKSNEDLTKL